MQCLVQVYEINDRIVVDLRSTEFAIDVDSFVPPAYRVAKPTDVQAFRLDAIKNKPVKIALQGDFFRQRVKTH